MTTDADAAPFCSVVVRTQGERMSLVDALTTLAAQVDRDIEVLLMVHHRDDGVIAGIQSVVDAFEPAFGDVVHVHHVVGGDRSAPLNAALGLARGQYVAFLDDDDIVTSDWISTFRRLADVQPGALLRSACVVQWIERRNGSPIDFEVVSGFEAPYPERYDLLDTIRSNRTPQCCVAVPMRTVHEFGIRFDDTLRVCEDWKFQLDVARQAGVVDDPAVTSVYRKWSGVGGSETGQTADVWIEDHERVVDDLDDSATTLPAGSLRRIHDLYTYVESLERDLGRRGPGDSPARFGN